MLGSLYCLNYLVQPTALKLIIVWVFVPICGNLECLEFFTMKDGMLIQLKV